MAPSHDRWLAVGLLLAATAVPRAAMATDWPDPALADGMQTAPVASHMIFNGTDMRSTVFTSGRSPDDVLAFYRSTWGKRVVTNRYAGWQVIGHREGDFYVTVQVRQDGQGSRGDIGVVRIPDSRAKVALGTGVPRPCDTVVINDIAYPDDATPARTLAMANRLSPAQNASYYRSHLVAEGWSPAGGDACKYGDAHCVMNYEKGGQKMLLALTAKGGESEIVINMMGQGVTP